MSKILTPISLWESFKPSLSTLPTVLSSKEENGIVLECVNFSGRDTGSGRVLIAAEYAYDKENPSEETVLIIPDSKETIDEKLLKMFVQRGYSALMVDYRGEWENCDFYTRYPQNVEYANLTKVGRRYDFVDESAIETCWYEWVAVGIYARKYIKERTDNGKVAVVGLRDGGEIAWKLGVAENFECIIPVSAAGWRAYFGKSKFSSVELDLNDERYRFIAGIDSQAYAPYVKCPVLMLCTTNDERFDNDRAHDTFSRINDNFISESSIAYSVQSNGCIGAGCIENMFLFLDKNLKNRQVFIPKPAEISVEVDKESNLVATAVFDDQGIVDTCGMYIAEDCMETARRDWSECPLKNKISPKEQQFYLNIYEKTSTVFVLCYVKYINGFTVWSKVVAKKISGKFRNMQSKCRVMYSDNYGIGCFAVADTDKCTVGGIFLAGEGATPKVVETSTNVKGLFSEHGLTTFRMNNPKYTPSAGTMLKLDIISSATATITISFFDMYTNEEYKDSIEIVGGVWQGLIAESNTFKNLNGASLPAFKSNFRFSITGPVAFAVNNIMWL